jgi:hypothetical protein
MYNILVNTETNVIVDYNYEFELYANKVVVVDDEQRVVYIYNDLSLLNAMVYQISTPFEEGDFIGGKYLFLNDEVVLNPDFSE